MLWGGMRLERALLIEDRLTDPSLAFVGASKRARERKLQEDAYNERVRKNLRATLLIAGGAIAFLVFVYVLSDRQRLREELESVTNAKRMSHQIEQIEAELNSLHAEKEGSEKAASMAKSEADTARMLADVAIRDAKVAAQKARDEVAAAKGDLTRVLASSRFQRTRPKPPR